MKIYLDKEYLQKISKGNQELLISEEQTYEMERIEGMLAQDIRFCSLVTGYRGTGKTSFIKYVLDDFNKKKENKETKEGKENKDILVVSFNAAKYQNYTIFIRRFVRELFFQMNRKGLVSPRLRKMYLHTFFDIKESYLDSYHKVKFFNKEIENEGILQFKSEIDVIKLIRTLIKIGLSIGTLYTIWNIIEKDLTKIICSVILLIVIVLCEVTDFHFTWEQIFKNKNHRKSGKQKEKEHRKLAEMLYDNEIAEYYVYDELQKIDDEKNNLVFVLDELDKVKDEELDMIFHDLKPLFLSGHCNFILIAGRNMEKYLWVSQKDVDSIATSIFTHRIYIPLSTIQEMREFAACFYMTDDGKNKIKEFYTDDNVQNYFNLKIYESKGVKRAFINSVLGDLRWEENRPYIDLLSKDISKEFQILFNILERMEEAICQEYTGPKRDELLQKLYCWIEKIRENQHTIFSQKDIIGEDESISESSFYSNIAEQTNLVHLLLDTMVKDDILEEKGEGYKWHFEIAVNNENYNDEEIEQTNRMMEYVEIFQKQWVEIGTILSCFAKYNGLIDASYEILRSEPEEYRLRLEYMISEFGIDNLEIKNSFLYLCKLYNHGIENDDMKDIEYYSREISATKAILVECLLKYTFKKSSYSMIAGETYDKIHFSNYKFDGVYYNQMLDETIFIEIKYYKEYMKLINSSLLFKMLGRIENYVKINEVSKFRFKLIIFTDMANEGDMNRFRKKCRMILEEIYERDKVQILLVPFNDYEMFKRQLDALIN